MDEPSPNVTKRRPLRIAIWATCVPLVSAACVASRTARKYSRKDACPKGRSVVKGITP